MIPPCPACGLPMFVCERCGGMGCAECGPDGKLRHDDAYHLMNFQRAEKNVRELAAETSRLRDALGKLVDEQEGPPSAKPHRAKAWQAAMDAARALLAKREEKTK